MRCETGPITALLREGLHNSVFPGAVLVAGHKGKTAFREAAGYRSRHTPVDVMTPDTIFDLASLTKPLATTLAVMMLVDNGLLDLDQELGGVLRSDMPADKRKLRVSMLLNHTSGLPDWKPYYLQLESHPKAERKPLIRKRIMEEALIRAPGKESLYSDLGFMLLEWIIEETSRMKMDLFLNHYFPAFFSTDKLVLGGFPVSGRAEKAQYAATEDCPWRKKVLRGEVHDENAFALGGFSGHAGLFGTAEDVFNLLGMIRGHYLGESTAYFGADTVERFLNHPKKPPESTWVLGWDTPSCEHSSAGKYFSRESVGHLGFTGTSIWMDLKKDVIVVFLTNRIHPTRSNEKIKQFRPVIHDAVMAVLGLS